MTTRRIGFLATVIATVVTVTCGGNSSPTAPTPTTSSTQTVTSLSLSSSAITLSVGATATVTATASYSDGTSAAVTPIWSSSNTGVATVSASGTVTAVAAGSATITGTFEGQGASVGITATTSTFESANDILHRCPRPVEVARSDRDLTLSFEGDLTVGQIVCSAAQSSRDLTLLEAQVYRVLTIMRHLKFDAPLPWTSNSLYGWMVSQIRGIRFLSDIANSSCCWDGMMKVRTTNSASLTYPTEFQWVAGLLVLFVHEARHAVIPHTCGNDDNTIDELGAWGVQYHMYLFLGSRFDPAFITPADRSEFMFRAQQTCRSRFCLHKCPS